MGPRTRSTTSSPVKKTALATTAATSPKHESVRVVIAPRQLSASARILQLKHPSDGSPKSFIFCPENGLLELKQTKVPSIDPRSIIFAPGQTTAGSNAEIAEQKDSLEWGYVNEEAQIFCATPYDLTFILLRLIAPSKPSTTKALYQPMEDLLESSEISDKSLHFILENGHSFVREALSSITDIVTAGDEEMFRYNEEKVFRLVVRKAQNVAKSGLPDSLEDRFVIRLLEAPILSVKREDSSVSVMASQSVVTEDTTSSQVGSESQSSFASTIASSTFSEASNVSTVIDLVEDAIPADVKHLQRVKTAYNFIAASCLPLYVTTRIAALLAEDSSTIDFSPLKEYMDKLAALRAEALAARSMADFGRKRNLEDDEIAEIRAEKKRKLEEEEKKRKANESRGVRDLKKVNVTGMKKMSDFFVKKPVAAKVKT